MNQKILLLSASLLTAGASLSLQVNAQKVERPNVLFMIYDDLNDWVLHPDGHPKPITPNMDRLRQRSISFINAHVVVPVCGASRASLFSGMYPQTTGLWAFGDWQKNSVLNNSVPLPLHFRNNGYEVYGVGKTLHEGAGGDFYTEYGNGPDYGPWPWKGIGRAFFTPEPTQYKKWIPYLPEPMHRDLNYGPLSNIPVWEADSTNNISGATGWYSEEEFLQNMTPFRYVNDDDRDLMPDEKSAAWAVKVLNKKHFNPFYLCVGFMRPHTPLYVPKKYYDMFPIDKITLPPYKKDDLDDCARVLRERWQWGYLKFDGLIKAGGVKAWKEFVQAYLASVAFADDQLGKLMAAMDANGLWDNTIVIMTSDNGYHLGEKNIIQKWHLWNESTRVPLFISIPQNVGKGAVCTHPVSLIDIFPTLLDLCALPVNPNKGFSNLPLNGYSLYPFLSDPKAGKWDGPSVALMGIKDETQPPHFSVVSDRYRYTLCGNGEEELYDHLKDPNEWTNLSKNPKYEMISIQLRQELKEIIDSTRLCNFIVQKKKHT